MINIVELSRPYKIAKGYEDVNGEPLKCSYCGSKNLKQTEEYCEEHWGVVEFLMICGDCGKRLGYWAYGEWIR